MRSDVLSLPKDIIHQTSQMPTYRDVLYCTCREGKEDPHERVGKGADGHWGQMFDELTST